MLSDEEPEGGMMIIGQKDGGLVSTLYHAPSPQWAPSWGGRLDQTGGPGGGTGPAARPERKQIYMNCSRPTAGPCCASVPAPRTPILMLNGGADRGRHGML